MTTRTPIRQRPQPIQPIRRAIAASLRPRPPSRLLSRPHRIRRRPRRIPNPRRLHHRLERTASLPSRLAQRQPPTRPHTTPRQISHRRRRIEHRISRHDQPPTAQTAPRVSLLFQVKRLRPAAAVPRCARTFHHAWRTNSIRAAFKQALRCELEEGPASGS